MGMQNYLTPGEWFEGRTEVDHGEWESDRCVWAPPTKEDEDAARQYGCDSEPTLVAKEVWSDADRRLILAAKRLLAACEGCLELLNDPREATAQKVARVSQAARAAVALAKGQKEQRP